MYFKQLAKLVRNVKGCKQPHDGSSTSKENTLQKLTMVRTMDDGAMLAMEARMMMMMMMEEQDATMYL